MLYITNSLVNLLRYTVAEDLVLQNKLFELELTKGIVLHLAI